MFGFGKKKQETVAVEAAAPAEQSFAGGQMVAQDIGVSNEPVMPPSGRKLVAKIEFWERWVSQHMELHVTERKPDALAKAERELEYLRDLKALQDRRNV